MRSEIKFISPSVKVTFTIGFFITILIIFLSLTFRTEFSIILLSVGGGIALIALIAVTRQTIKLLYFYQVNRLEIASKQQELRLATYRADKAQTERFVLMVPRGQRIITLPENNIRVIDAPVTTLPATATEFSQTPIELLPALDSVQRCLIVGVTDTGKTTLMQWIVYRRSQVSQVVVIDPHGYPGKWTGCEVIGTGRNYANIDRALAVLLQIMTKRYDEIGKGIVAEGNHPKLTILIDEWRAITGNVDRASDTIKALLTESRKAAFSVFVSSQSDRAKPLGLMGEYDLKDSFAVVRLSIVNGHRQATLDMGNGEVPAILPGEFTAGMVDSSDVITDFEIEPNATEAAVIALHEQGESHARISEEVWGYKSSKNYPKIDAILEKFDAK